MMEHTYYKLAEVAEMLKISTNDIIRSGNLGNVNIHILTAKFFVFKSIQKIKHNLPFDSFDDFDEYRDRINEEIIRYANEFSVDADDLFEPHHIKLSQQCLMKLEAGECDAKVHIDYECANDDYLVHFWVINAVSEVPDIQNCELIILHNDLVGFQKLINKNEQINFDTSLITIDNKEVPAVETIGSPVRKKRKLLVRVTSEGLDLIHYIFDKYNINYLDQMSGLEAWSKIVSGEIEHSLIQQVTSKLILFNDDSKLTKSDFLEKYRKRFV
ncbi:MAG: hypothetical protein QX191_01650 [Methylococcaceae bacterium]